MLCTYTRRLVAAVQDTQLRNRAVCQKPCNSMGALRAFGCTQTTAYDLTVSFAIGARGPLPARTEFRANYPTIAVNLRPETLHERPPRVDVECGDGEGLTLRHGPLRPLVPAPDPEPAHPSWLGGEPGELLLRPSPRAHRARRARPGRSRRRGRRESP